MAEPTVNWNASPHAELKADPGRGSDYAEDVEDQLIREAQERAVRDPSFFDPFGGLGSYLRQLHAAANQAEENQRQQGEQLAATQDHRDPPDLGGTDYLGHEHAQLKQWVTTNFQPQEVHDVGRAWNSIGDTLRDLEAELRSRAGREFTENWRGGAAERAHSYTIDLADFAGRTGDGFKLMGNRISVQGDAAEEARSMPDPVEFDLRTELLGALTSPNPAAGMAQLEARFAQKQEAHAEAARYLATMEGRFAKSAATMPAFAPVPRFADGAAGRPAGTGDRPTGVGPGGSGGHGGPGAVGTQAATSPSVVSPTGTAGPAGPGAVGPSRPAGPAPTPPASAPPVTRVPGRQGDGRPGRPGAAVARPGSFGWPGRNGPGGQGGRLGYGAGSASGRGPGGPGGPGVGSGGPGAGADQRGAGSGGPGAASRPGPGGGSVDGSVDGRGTRHPPGGMGAGRGSAGLGQAVPGLAGLGRRDDDETRRRPSWLVETDEHVWGDGGLVAPPVIGEPSPDR